MLSRSAPWLLGGLLLPQGCSCVAGRSRIRTPGGWRVAQEIVVGDRVLAVDAGRRHLVVATVAAVAHARRECVALHVGNDILLCTPEHPLFDPERDEFAPAAAWVEGSRTHLLSCTQVGTFEVIRLDRIEREVGTHLVVDLTIERRHPTFVAEGIVVHNKSYGPPVSGFADGPEVSLPEGTDEVEFDLRACLDGNDVNAGLYMRVHAIFRWLGARDERDEDATPWVGLALLGDPQQAYEDGPARPGGTNLDVVVVQSQACSTPLKVVFMRLDGGAEAVGVEWSVTALPDSDPGTNGVLGLEIDEVP
jgi:hypothetical protein